jgi:hypothetical protein
MWSWLTQETVFAEEPLTPSRVRLGAPECSAMTWQRFHAVTGHGNAPQHLAREAGAWDRA